MIQIEQHGTSNLVEITVTEKLESSDYDRFIPRLEKLIRIHGKLRLLWMMHNFEGWKPQAFLKDARFDMSHSNDFSKVAMVGHKDWQKLMTDLMKPFTKAEVKYFDEGQRTEALNWLKQP